MLAISITLDVSQLLRSRLVRLLLLPVLGYAYLGTRDLFYVS